MKITVKQPVEIEISHVRISVPLRKDTIEELGEGFPLLDGGRWTAVVDVETGRIQDWNKSGEFSLCDKVRDEGTYELLSPSGFVVGRIEDNYVPNRLIPGEYGDYIELQIKDGVVMNWPKKPEFGAFFGEED